jgi:hypothetical protein
MVAYFGHGRTRSLPSVPLFATFSIHSHLRALKARRTRILRAFRCLKRLAGRLPPAPAEGNFQRLFPPARPVRNRAGQGAGKCGNPEHGNQGGKTVVSKGKRPATSPRRQMTLLLDEFLEALGLGDEGTIAALHGEFVSNEQAHACGGPRGTGQGNCELGIWQGKIKVAERLERRWWCGMAVESLLAANSEIGLCLLVENSEWQKMPENWPMPRRGIALGNVFRSRGIAFGKVGMVKIPEKGPMPAGGSVLIWILAALVLAAAVLCPVFAVADRVYAQRAKQYSIFNGTPAIHAATKQLKFQRPRIFENVFIDNLAIDHKHNVAGTDGAHIFGGNLQVFDADNPLISRRENPPTGRFCQFQLRQRIASSPFNWYGFSQDCEIVGWRLPSVDHRKSRLYSAIGVKFYRGTGDTHIGPQLPLGSIFHQISLTLDRLERAPQKPRLPDHRECLDEANYHQTASKPFEFPLYIEVFLFCFGFLLVAGGGCLYIDGRGRWTICVVLLGSCLLASCFTSALCCDPAFWRVGWRGLTGQEANRCQCADQTEYHQTFLHDAENVSQIHLDAAWGPVRPSQACRSCDSLIQCGNTGGRL